LQLEVNVDDVTGETLAHTIGALLDAGANDAWVTPIVMKKGRPAYTVSAMCDPALGAQVSDVLRRETGSLGVRGAMLDRWPSSRTEEEVEVAGYPLRVKVSAGRVKVEHDDAARIAKRTGLPLREVISMLIIIAACFVCGVLVRTGPGLRAKDAFERAVLEKIPGYALIRGLAGKIAGKEDEHTFTVVLAEIEDALVPAFLVEECDEDHCAIFVPSVPTPAAGAIYIIAKSRVHLVDVPFTRAVSVISKWGAGAGELLAGMKAVEAGPPKELKRAG